MSFMRLIMGVLMDKWISSRHVKMVLRKELRLRPLRKGDRSGREMWADCQGRTCRPVLRHKDVSLRNLYCLGMELECKGITTRAAFMKALRME
jgi:hypothetical protein